MIPKPNSVRLFTFVLVFALSLGFAAGYVLLSAAPVRVVEAAPSGAQPPLPSGEPGPENNHGPTAPVAASASPDAVPPTVPGTLYKTYSGTSFTPHGTSASATAYAGGGGVYRTDGVTELDCLLELPSGVRVTEVIFYFRDDSAATVDFWFATYQPDIGSYSNIASTNSAGVDTNAIVTRVFSGSPLTTIDNTRYQYLLEVALNETNSSHAIFGARVGYVISTTSLPLILR